MSSREPRPDQHEQHAANPRGEVEITSSGRGGSIYYREGINAAVFDWEFAASPALVIICGSPAKYWDQAYPWAKGRQAQICDFVGAEALRQQAPDCRFEVELDTGTIIVKPATSRARQARTGARRQARGTSAYERFKASIVPRWGQWEEGQTYDIAALSGMTAAQRADAVSLLTGRDITWREVEALAVIDTPKARAAVDAASRDHLSIDTRLAAAEVMHRQGRMADIDRFIARQIRHLDRPANGLARALAMAERYQNGAVKQALLWASYNATECAPDCARLLLRLTGAAQEPFAGSVQSMLLKLGLHNSSFDRETAFKELCLLVGMNLEHDAAD